MHGLHDHCYIILSAYDLTVWAPSIHLCSLFVQLVVLSFNSASATVVCHNAQLSTCLDLHDRSSTAQAFSAVHATIRLVGDYRH